MRVFREKAAAEHTWTDVRGGWRKSYGKELIAFYPSPNITTLIGIKGKIIQEFVAARFQDNRYMKVVKL